MDNMSDLNRTLEAIDTAIAKYNADIKRGEALDRLMTNQDFLDVVMDGYINVEADRLFTILTDPADNATTSLEEVQGRLASIRHFKGYVGTTGAIKMDAERAKYDKLSDEVYRSEVTATFASNGE